MSRTSWKIPHGIAWNHSSNFDLGTLISKFWCFISSSIDDMSNMISSYQTMNQQDVLHGDCSSSCMIIYYLTSWTTIITSLVYLQKGKKKRNLRMRFLRHLTLAQSTHTEHYLLALPYYPWYIYEIVIFDA